MVYNNMKGMLFLVLVLALWANVPASADKAALEMTERHPIMTSTCEECYYSYYEGSYSFDCYYYYCREEVYNKLFDNKAKSETNYDCDSCAYYSDDSYYTCVYYYCKTEILSALETLYGSKEEETLESCTDTCYYYWYYYNYDYYDCVYAYCKTEGVDEKLITFAKVENKVETMSNCDACYYYYTGDDYWTCVYYYCKAEIVDGNKLFATKSSVQTSEPVTLNACDDCYWYYYYGYTSTYYDCVYVYCKEEILKLSEENFSGKLSFVQERPEILYTYCELCDYYYTGDAWYDCIYYYCKDEIVDTQQLIGSKSVDVEKIDLSRCTNYCYYTYYLGYYTYNEYYNCYYYYCKNEVASLYKELNTKNFIKTKKESELYSCSSCHYDYYEYAYHCYYCYKEAILDKTALFAEEPKDAKAGTCEYCYYDYTYSYYDCVYYYCKNEVMEKAKLTVINNLSKLVSIAPIQSPTCSQCVYYYNYNAVYYAYDCAYWYCRDEILSKNVLFAGYSEEQKQDYCYECYDYDYDGYYDCTYWYCKDQILEKFEELYGTEKVEGSSCEGTCYMDWYFYGSDYFTCASKFCKGERSENLITIPEFIQEKGGVQLDCYDTCYYYYGYSNSYYDCVYYYCKTLTTEKLAASIPTNKVETYTECDECYDYYYYGYLTYSEYVDCYYNWCKNSDSKMIKAVKVDSVMLSTCDDCWTLYYYGYMTYSEYDSCYYYYCKEDKESAVILLENVGKELNIKSVKTSYCDDCWTYYYYGYLTYNEYYNCAYYYCKENEIKTAEKTELSVKTEKLYYCDDCYYYYSYGYFTYSEYYNCVYYYCKEKVLELTATTKKTSDLVSENSVSFDYCYYCGNYDCYYYYCKSEVMSKLDMKAESAIENNQELTKCDNCYYLYYYGYFTYNDYAYCYYWYCKNEILSQVDLHKRTTSLVAKEKADIKTYTAETCYFFEYKTVYGYDYYYCYIYYYKNKFEEGSSYLMSGFAISAVVLGALAYAGYSKRRQESSVSEVPYKIIL
ncbi:hypothetical protein SteCoe_8079 [Stentor coeruleus]|uniref:Uncharacterized protein n=1 Tax=Stentor coeruleus TaxID=5963 RepID=A0A1R2CL18_9CILI|nr:hypothetical protein SteCoe_8079 [Stentor coeruleus]